MNKEVTDRLRKCLKALETQSKIWNTAGEECQKYIDNLNNILDQIECCLKSDLEKTPLGQSLTDIQDKLMIKLLRSMDIPLCKLNNLLSTMKKAHDRAHASYRAMEQLLINRKCQMISFSAWSTTRPPASMILLAILSILDLMQEHNCRKNFILHCFANTSLSVVTSSTKLDGLKEMISEWNTSEPLKPMLDDLFMWCSDII